MQIIIATKNEAKIREIKEILNSSIDFKIYKDFSDWPYVEETGQTFKENALLKAKALAQKYKMGAIADDSGLVVEVLGGEPGVYSSRYAGEEGNDEKNIEKLLRKMRAFVNRKAAFVTVAVYCDSKGSVFFAEGRVGGNIIEQPKGKGGFGYDPVFVPDGFDKTFAEMSAEEKNKLSHRGKAFRKLKDILNSFESTPGRT